jgi:hypothetical protein
MNSRNFLLTFVSLVSHFAMFSHFAMASVIIIPGNDEVKIPVDKGTGTLLQMPFSVKTITPAVSFEITDVASDVDLGTGSKMDVRLFQVRALPGAKSERVTFVLGNGKTVQTQLVPAEEAEKHYDLVFPAESKKRRDQKFLQPEIALMKAMIRDTAGDFARQVTNETVTLKNTEGLSAKLVRVFAAQGTVGYAFEIRNTSGSTLKINVGAFSLGDEQRFGNKAVLIHAENESLEPCGLFSSPECKTRLFIVARGEVGEPRNLSVNSVASFPYVRTDAETTGEHK